MSDRNQYFPQDSKNLSYDVPHPDSRKPPIGDRVPSGVIPMESIAQRGRAYRNLSQGKLPWWLLIGGWLFFAFPPLIIGLSVISEGISSIFDFSVVSSTWGILTLTILKIIAVIILSFLFFFPTIIMLRGTLKKLNYRAKNRRKN